MGWNPGTEKEFFSQKELIQSFDIKDLNLSSAIFDEDKLLWLNGEHIKSLSNENILNHIKPFLKESSDKQIEKLIPHLRSGFKNFKQASQTIELFLENKFTIQESVYDVLKWPKSKRVIKQWVLFLKEHSKNNVSFEDFKLFQKKTQDTEGIKGKDFFMPLRCALMGCPEGIEIKILIQLLEKHQLLKRAQKVLNLNNL